MKDDKISMRQFMVLVVTALLMPASALLPTLTARLAGGAGWVSMAGAAVLLPAAGWAARRQSAAEPRRVASLIYMIWTFLVLMVSLRLSGARLAEIYGERGAWMCTGAMLLLAVWMARGRLAAFARAAEIFYLALAVLLAGILLLAAFQVEWSNLVPARAEMAGLPESGLAAAGLLLNLYPVTVLLRRTQGEKGSGRRAARWIVLFCGAMALLLGAVNGCLGAVLTGKVPSPFLIMVQGLGIQGAFQRGEALIISVWTLSDLALTGALLHAWRELAWDLRPGRWCRESVIPAAAAAMAGGWLLFRSEETLWRFSSTVLPVLGVIFGSICPIFAVLLDRRKGK